MKKKMSELPPEEQDRVRKYNREQKQKSRTKLRAASYIPTADEAADNFAADHPDRVKELDTYAKDFTARVTEDLGRELGSPQIGPTGHALGWDHDEEFTVDRVVRTLVGLRKNWIQRVRNPEGELVSGMYFADSAARTIESAHRNGLMKSATFSETYRELLELLDRRYDGQQTDDAAIIRAELTHHEK
jgi:hypothetical protein